MESAGEERRREDESELSLGEHRVGDQERGAAGSAHSRLQLAQLAVLLNKQAKLGVRERGVDALRSELLLQHTKLFTYV